MVNWKNNLMRSIFCKLINLICLKNKKGNKVKVKIKVNKIEK